MQNRRPGFAAGGRPKTHVPLSFASRIVKALLPSPRFRMLQPNTPL
jgi:hypothetical protein